MAPEKNRDVFLQIKESQKDSSINTALKITVSVSIVLVFVFQVF